MISNKFTLHLSTLVLAVLCSACQPSKDELDPKSKLRPNILFVIVDDMGMADIGSFGGEIDTPNLDKLAFNGLRLSNFSTAPTCSPSRAMLLTGVDSHLNGLGNMLEETSPNQKGQAGYEGILNERVVTITELLRDKTPNPERVDFSVPLA